MKIAKLVPELICSDIEQSSKFYTDVLGFNVLFARPEERFVYLERDGAQLMIEQSTGRRFLVGELEQPYGRGINLQIKTDKVDDLYARVQAAKASIYLPMEERGYRCNDVYLVGRQFIVQDPDGYLLRFFEDLGSRRTEF